MKYDTSGNLIGFFSVGLASPLKLAPKFRKGGHERKKNDTETGVAQVLIEL